MKRLRSIKAVEDLAWLETADISLVFTAEIDASPEEVFDVLADHEGWTSWFSPVKSVTDIGPSAGVGARRRVQVPPLTVDEKFIAWDRPSRYTFTITAISLPVVTRMAEDWRLEESAAGTRVTNVIAADLPRWAQPTRPIVRLVVRQLTASGVVDLKKRLAASSA